MDVADVGVTVYFGLQNTDGTYFVIGDATKGVIGSTDYVIAGDTGTDIVGDAYSLTVGRGRNREIDEYEAGTCQVQVHNVDRTYDDTNALSPYTGKLTPGKRCRVTIWGQPVFTGMVDDWDNEWSVDADATTTMFAVDGLGELGMREFDEWTTTAAQAPGARLTDSLNRTEVNSLIARDFDTGVSSLQSDLVTWGSNVLNYLQLVVKSDAGRLFCTRENVLKYQDRHALVNATSSVDFTDDGSGIKFHGITTTVGSDLLFNRVGVDREGGTLQTKEDASSQAAIGVRALGVSGLLMDTDAEAEAMAGWLLSLYKTPTTRISSITVKVNALEDSDRGAVTALDIGDVVSLTWTPQGVGDPLEQLLVIEGVNHVVDGGVHVMTLYTSLASVLQVFIIGDATLGRIGPTGGVIAF